jgi:hypothetical protein
LSANRASLLLLVVCVCTVLWVQLWGVALRSLKGVLESAFEAQLSSAPEMLQVKGFVVLMCVALERAGHQVRVVVSVFRHRDNLQWCLCV